MRIQTLTLNTIAFILSTETILLKKYRYITMMIWKERIMDMSFLDSVKFFQIKKEAIIDMIPNITL